jgi:glycosyltransferase involved in cell wall biosynthesis
MYRVPFVHTSHVLPDKVLDFGASDALDMKILQGSFSASISRRLLTDFYSNCDAIIALNQPALTSLRKFGYGGKIFIIPNGRDLDRYAQCAIADVEAEEKVLIFVGYLSERKNQVYLVDAHRHLPAQYRLVLLGKALKPGYKDKLKERCGTHGLDNVVFPGQVPHDEIPSYLERAHVFVSASKMEVQSLVVIEAMASGTPVVGLANETIDELVDDDVGERLSKETAPQEFAASVQRICRLSQSQYRERCQNARDRVSHLDWSNVINQTVAAYRELMEEKDSFTKEEGAMLEELVSTLPSGEVKDILTERIESAQREPGPVTGFLMDLSLGKKWRALKRVPGSTWLLAAGTIVVSLVGYIFMKGRGEPANG